MRLSEPAINAILADLLFEKLSGWFSSIIPGHLARYRKRAELDVLLTELFGLKVVIEAKLGDAKIDEAINQCKERLDEGLADVCIAVAYSEKVRDAPNTEKLRHMLSESSLRVVVLPPDKSEIDLGKVTLETLIDSLNKHSIYDRVISRELIEELAKEIGQCLNKVKELDRNVLANVASMIEKSFEMHGGVSGSEEEEETEGEE